MFAVFSVSISVKFFPEPVLLLPQLFTVNRMRSTPYIFAANGGSAEEFEKRKKSEHAAICNNSGQNVLAFETPPG